MNSKGLKFIYRMQRIKELRDLLWKAFVWHETKQGFHYWNTVEKNLGEMANDKR